MSVIRKKGGENFGLKAAMLGISMEQQLRALNNMYRGSVEFCIGEYFDNFDNANVLEKVICIKWTADNVGLLELPECEHFSIDLLFSPDYEGNLRILIMPKCTKNAHFYFDDRAWELRRLVFRTGTILGKCLPRNVFIEADEGVYERVGTM